MDTKRHSDGYDNAVQGKNSTVTKSSPTTRNIILYSLLGILSIAVLVIISALHGASFQNLGLLFGTAPMAKTLPIFTSPNNVYSCVNSTTPRLSGMVYLPCVPQPSQTGDIVGFDIQNNNPIPIPSHYITMGEIFPQGKFPAGDQLEAVINGTVYNAQADVKTNYSDGSGKMVVVSFLEPAMPAHTTYYAMLRAVSGTPGTPIPLANLVSNPAYNITVHIHMMTEPNVSSYFGYYAAYISGSGEHKYSMVFSPSGATGYAVTYENGTMLTFNTSTMAISNEIAVGSEPIDMILNASGATAYIADQNNNTVAVVNIASKTVTRMIKGFNSPSTLKLSPSGSTLYVLNLGNSTMSVVNVSTYSITHEITGFYYPSDIAISPNGTTAFVPNMGPYVDGVLSGTSISKVNLLNYSISNTIVLGPYLHTGPYSAYFNSAGTKLYVLLVEGSAITVMNPITDAVLYNITNIGYGPGAMVVNSAGTIAYVLNGYIDGVGSTLNVVNLLTNKTIRTISNLESSQTESSHPMALSPSGNHIYIGCSAWYCSNVEKLSVGNLANPNYTINLHSLLASGLASNTVSYWLQGSTVTEGRVNYNVSGSFHVMFDMREYANGSTYTNIMFANDYVMQPIGGDVNYNLTIQYNGNVSLQKNDIFQPQYTEWQWPMWSSGFPQSNIVHDIAELERVGAILPYNLSDGISASLLSGYQ